MTSLELWKLFVDSFATLHDGVHRKWVAEDGRYPDTADNKEINGVLAEISHTQRQVIAEMLVRARRGGIHDALVVINDRMAVDGGRYSEGEVEMAFQPFGSELYYDYVCRREGDAWPDDDEAQQDAESDSPASGGPAA